MTAIEFSIAAIWLGLYGFFIAVLFCVALLRASLWRKKAKAAAARFSITQTALVDYLAGSNDLTRLREFAKNREDFANVVLGFQGTVGGGALNRLCEMGLELGLVHDWVNETRSRDPVRRRLAFARLAFVSAYEPCLRVSGDLLLQALQDGDPEVRISAAEAVIQAGKADDIPRVFHMAVAQNLLTRVVLTPALRRYAVDLAQATIPEVLHSSDVKSVQAAMEILLAWERAIPFQDLCYLLDHRDKRIRLQALNLAPLVPLAPASRTEIVRALNDPDPEISMAAALSAGKLRIEEALPFLARLLRVAPAEVARTAANALAEMPPRGWQALEELSERPNMVTAAAAMEALARARGTGF